MTKTAVMFVAPSAYPLGGVAQWLDYLLPGLEAFGWKCTLALTQGRFHDVDAYLKRHPWHDVIAVSNPTGSTQGRIESLKHAIRDAAPNLLVVTNVVCAYDAVRVLRETGQKSPRVAMALHGLQADLLGDLRSGRDVIDSAIAVNRLAACLAEAEIGDPSRVFYAPGGACIAVRPDPRQPARNRRLNLIYCGRIEQRQKRVLDLAVLAERLLRQGVAFSISIAGSGPDENELRRRITASGLDDSFAWLGELPASELARQYTRHDALLITSSWETGPLVAWEAMGCGLPVISSRYVGSGLEAALVDNCNSLLFPVGDMAAAAQAVHALQFPGVAQQISERATELVRDRYTQQRSVQMWRDALHGVLALPTLTATTSQGNRGVSAGRLDRWLGAVNAERARRLLGLSFSHREAGGEWPHTRHYDEQPDTFLQRANCLDHLGPCIPCASTADPRNA